MSRLTLSFITSNKEFLSKHIDKNDSDIRILENKTLVLENSSIISIQQNEDHQINSSMPYLGHD